MLKKTTEKSHFSQALLPSRSPAFPRRRPLQRRGLCLRRCRGRLAHGFGAAAAGTEATDSEPGAEGEDMGTTRVLGPF